MSLDAWKRRNGTPQSAGLILATTLKRARLTEKLRQYEFFSSWSEIAGPDISAASFPEKILKGKILVVRVIDSVWAHQLSMQKTELLTKLRAFDSTITVEDIRFLSGNPRDFKQSRDFKKPKD